MGKQKPSNEERGLLEAILYLLSGVLLGLGIRIALNILGVSFPTVNQVTNLLRNAVRIWSDIATVDSPRTYALNAVIITTIMSAVLNSSNRKSPSTTISGILTAPGVEIWSRTATGLIDAPIIGTLLYGLGGAARFYLWFGSILFYFLYPAMRILNSNASLFVVTASAILASITFGAVFGRFEKGLVLSIKATSNDIRSRGSRNWSGKKKVYWALMTPLSLLTASFITYLSFPSMKNPTLGKLFSSLSSVFITTSLSVMALFYLAAGLMSFLSSCSDAYHSYREGNRGVQEVVRARWKSYIEDEFSKGKSDDNMSGYPDEVAEVLREDKKE